MTQTDPQWLNEPRSKEWIELRANELQSAVNAELRERGKYHSRLTFDALVESVINKHLNAFWSYQTVVVLGEVPQVIITAYNGAVDESM